MNKKIKVAWFASAIVGRNASGTAQVARKIVEYILINESKRIELFLIVKNNHELKLIYDDRILLKASVIMLPTVNGKFLRNSRQFYKYVFRSKPEFIDILHFPVARLYPFYWKFPADKFYCTFHAGGEISVPQDKFVFSRTIYNLIAKKQWKHLDKIFADSDFGVSEINQFYRIPKNKIDKIHPGADHLWGLKTSKIDIDKSKIIITVIGRWQKYKNVHTVLSAFNCLDELLSKQFHLFLIGKPNFGYGEKVLQLVQKIDSERLTHYAYLPDSELKFLYRNSQLVICPSINEGFGLPAFEAFGEGAPIAIHQGLPADHLLSNDPQVYANDMLDFNSIVALFKNYKKLSRVSVVTRRRYLTRQSLTWNMMCQQYVDKYLQP